MVRGSLSYRLSVLWRILSLRGNTLTPGWKSQTMYYVGPVFFVWVFVCLFLSMFPYVRPVSEERDIKNMSLPKIAALGEVFKYCVIGRANDPCFIGEKVSYVTLGDFFSHIYICRAEHCHDCLMHLLKYCMCLWVFDTGWLTLQTVWIRSQVLGSAENAEQSRAEWAFPEPSWKMEPGGMACSRVQNSVGPSGANLCKTWDVDTKFGISLINMATILF